MHRYHYSYEEFLHDSKILTQRIDWSPDTILGISRGGLTLSHLLGEYYNIRRVYTVNTIGYDDTKKLDRIELFNMPDLSGSLNVLIVDDIVDSGDTLKLVIDLLSSKYPGCTFRSATLFYKKSAIIKPNWYVREPNGWIDFFWSVDLKNKQEL